MPYLISLAPLLTRDLRLQIQSDLHILMTGLHRLHLYYEPQLDPIRFDDLRPETCRDAR
jgi:hypothetical protein